VNAGCSVQSLRAWLRGPDEIALLDVREHGQYGEGHLFLAVPLPFSRLEADAPALLPRRGVRIVVYDDGASTVAARAAARLGAMGYTDVAVLEGGAAAWIAAGHRLFDGVNVPSKAFGEMVEHALSVPSVSAEELAAMQLAGDVVVADGRTEAEFARMTIPGAVSCPNGELAQRITTLVADERQTIVINCAGRTRSIMGAATLMELGLPNPIRALRNGTMGWQLAGLTLRAGAAPELPLPAGGAARAAMASRAAAFAARCGVAWIGVPEAAVFAADPARTLYLLDIRTAGEFAADALPGAVHAPGGQLMQATDQWVAVRRARLLLLDDDNCRAPVVAGWLRRMGMEAMVLAGGKDQWPALAQALPGRAAPKLPPGITRLTPADLPPDAALLDLRASMAFRRAHLAGAIWSIRPRLVADAIVQGAGAVVLVASAEIVARAAAAELRDAGIAVQGWLADDAAAWRGAGLAVVATPGEPPDAEAIDFLFFTHDRHDGNLDAARRYLAWETGLLDRMDADEHAVFPPMAALAGGAA
jgi:rhodanese-related sulfurtransferase